MDHLSRKTCSCGALVKTNEKACHYTCSCGELAKTGDLPCHRNCPCGALVKIYETDCHRTHPCPCGVLVKTGEKDCHYICCSCDALVKTGEKVCHDSKCALDDELTESWGPSNAARCPCGIQLENHMDDCHEYCICGALVKVGKDCHRNTPCQCGALVKTGEKDCHQFDWYAAWYPDRHM